MGGKTVRILIIVILLGGLIWMSGCSPANEVKIGMEKNGGEVQVKTGETLAIALESTPPPGYSWQVVQTDASLLPQDGEPAYQQTSKDKNIVGTGGVETLRFKATAPGTVTLQLGYLRSWETGVEPVQTFNVTVTIQ